MYRFALFTALAMAHALPAAAQVCVLSFANDPAKDRVVTDFANTLHEKRTAMGTNLLSAIDNFETTMQFASSFETEPKVAEVLLETALSESADFLVGLADEAVPGTKQVTAAIKAVYAEAKRAGAAKASESVGAWIRAERAVVSNHMTGATASSLPTSVAIKDAITEELCWLREGGGNLDHAIQKIAGAQAELGDVPTEQTYRRALFESWINANFRAIGMEDETPGTVHVSWEVDVDGDPADHQPGSYPLVWDDDDWSAKVVLASPYGERVAGGLNELGVPPLEVRSVKKVCFETDGIAGGTATYCGGLAPDGRVRFEPNASWAVQAFQSSKWRSGTTSFRD